MRFYKPDSKIRYIISESWAVSWPMTMIMLSIFLIGLSDVYVAGRFGKDMQAAYGLAYQFFFVFSIIAMSLTVGSISVISRLFTSDRKDDFHLAISTSFIASVFAGAISAIISFASSEYFVGVFKIPEGLRDHVLSLIRIYSIALLFNYILIHTNGMLRASNMIRRSLLTMTLVCILNVGLNFYLAFRTPLGFSGIVVATIVSKLAGSVLNICYSRRLLSAIPRFSMAMAKKIFWISWPVGGLQILWNLGIMVIFFILSMLPRYNIETMAALTNGLKIEAVIFLPAFAFNMANAVIVGNMLGKAEKDNAFSSGIATAVIGLFIVTFMSVVVMLNARHIASFLSDNSLVVNESVKYIYISLIAEPIMAWGVILGGALNGAGDTRGVMTIIALSIWLVRIPLCYILGIVLGFGAAGIWWSMNASIAVQTVFVARRYFARKWLTHPEVTISL